MGALESRERSLSSLFEVSGKGLFLEGKGQLKANQTTDSSPSLCVSGIRFGKVLIGLLSRLHVDGP